jgi:hypothetical protein
MSKTIIWMLAMASFLFSCSNSGTSEKQVVQKEYVPVTITPGTVEHITLNDSISQMLLARGRKIAGKTKVALKVELRKAIAEGGLEHAVEFCHTRAMEITDSISLAEQVIIKRLAKKNRNPHNATSEEESTIYKGYIMNWISNMPLQSMVTWDDEGRPVYYNPIMTEALCLNCHGTVGEEVNPQLAEKIAQLYPEDKAVGFSLREVRGMWSITFPEYMVVAAE